MKEHDDTLAPLDPGKAKGGAAARKPKESLRMSLQEGLLRPSNTALTAGFGVGITSDYEADATEDAGT